MSFVVSLYSVACPLTVIAITKICFISGECMESMCNITVKHVHGGLTQLTSRLLLCGLIGNTETKSVGSFTDTPISNSVAFTCKRGINNAFDNGSANLHSVYLNPRAII